MASYPIPNWLGPQAALGWGALAGEAARARATQEIERDRLAQQSAQFAIESQQRAQQLNEEMKARQDALNYQHLLQSQKIAIDQAYKQQMLGLDEQRIDLAQKNFESKTADAARKFAATQAFQKAMLPPEQGGEGLDATKAALKYLAPYMTGTETARLSTVPSDFKPGNTFDIPGASGEGLVQVAPGRWEKYAKTPQTITNVPEAVSVKDESGNVVGHLIQVPGQRPHYQSDTKTTGSDLATLVRERQAKNGGQQPKGIKQDETIRLTRDGRRAVFNSKTREFIRWADEEPANASQ